MKDTIQKIFIILIVITFYVFTHELTHDRIFHIYDCEEIEWGFDKYGFYVESICDNDEANLAIAQNEIVGYTVALPLFVIIIILILRERI